MFRTMMICNVKYNLIIDAGMMIITTFNNYILCSSTCKDVVESSLRSSRDAPRGLRPEPIPGVCGPRRANPLDQGSDGGLGSAGRTAHRPGIGRGRHCRGVVMGVEARP
jgi:hypothetical protein